VELVPGAGANARRADYADDLLATDIDPQQRIEADEMIHVHVADKQVRDASRSRVLSAERSPASNSNASRR
jgi:hypothetical protein